MFGNVDAQPNNKKREGDCDMYKLTMEVEPKNDFTLKQSYEKISELIRKFIVMNEKELSKNHYEDVFSYYSFSNPENTKGKTLYEKGQFYTVELKTLQIEFLDMKLINGIETQDVKIVSVSGGKLFYKSEGVLVTETPVFMKTKPIRDEEYKDKVKEKIRENIVFRYLKSGINSSDDIDYVRENCVKDIEIADKIVTVPFENKKTTTGKPLLYHCLGLKVTFKDNDLAKEVEKIIYASGLGKMTSCGFGYMK